MPKELNYKLSPLCLLTASRPADFSSESPGDGGGELKSTDSTALPISLVN